MVSIAVLPGATIEFRSAVHGFRSISDEMIGVLLSLNLLKWAIEPMHISVGDLHLETSCSQYLREQLTNHHQVKFEKRIQDHFAGHVTRKCNAVHTRGHKEFVNLFDYLSSKHGFGLVIFLSCSFSHSLLHVILPSSGTYGTYTLAAMLNKLGALLEATRVLAKIPYKKKLQKLHELGNYYKSIIN